MIAMVPWGSQNLRHFRNLVGVRFKFNALSSMPGAAAVGVGDAIRLWHKEACKLVQSNQAFGPRCLRDGGVWTNRRSSLSPE
jgi:hypothetical protein